MPYFSPKFLLKINYLSQVSTSNIRRLTFSSESCYTWFQWPHNNKKHQSNITLLDWFKQNTKNCLWYQAWMGKACDCTCCAHIRLIKNTTVVCCMPKPLYGVLSQLFLIHAFSSLLNTAFTISLVSLVCSPILDVLLTFLLPHSYFKIFL